jgi:hypothetical protein
MSKKIHTIFAIALALTTSLATPRSANAFFFMIIPLPNLAKPPELQKIIDALEKSKQTKAVAYVSENKIISTKYWTWSDVSGQISQQEANETALKRCSISLNRLKETTVGGQPVYDFGQNECKLYPFRTGNIKINSEANARAPELKPTAFAEPSDAPTNTKKLVTAAIREGRCDDAKDLALRINDLDLAEQALRLCVPSTK